MISGLLMASSDSLQPFLIQSSAHTHTHTHTYTSVIFWHTAGLFVYFLSVYLLFEKHLWQICLYTGHSTLLFQSTQSHREIGQRERMQNRLKLHMKES